MSLDDTLGGFVLDASALAALGGGENIYATTWADRAAVRGIVLLIPAAALSEAWQQIRRHEPGDVEQMRDLLVSPMVLIETLDETEAARAGELVDCCPRNRLLEVDATTLAAIARLLERRVVASSSPSLSARLRKSLGG